MREFFLFLWQFPQNLLGFILKSLLKAEKEIDEFSGIEYYVVKKFSFGVSLGKYIIFGVKHRNPSRTTILHEHGHQIQSVMLGWLYLIVIGIPSAIHNLISRKIKCDYYKFWTEKWADKLANVKR